MVLNNSIIEHVEKEETFKESEIIFMKLAKNTHMDDDAKTYYININDLRNIIENHLQPSIATYHILDYWTLLPPL